MQQKPRLVRVEQEGQLSFILGDDSYLLIESDLEYQKNINATVGLLCKLDFVTHSDRSILKPTQNIEFLGFVIDSVI